MEASPFFVTAVFLLGASVGALLVSLQRQCTIERIKNEFEQELTLAINNSKKTTVDRRSMVPENAVLSRAPESKPEEGESVEVFWENLPIVLHDSEQPHAQF